MLLGLVVVLLAAAPAALAHKGGKAEPRIAANATGAGYSRMLTIKLTDVDDGDPIRGAVVSVAAEMTTPHVMRLIPQDLREASTGTYRGRYSFIMRGDWTLDIEVTGKKVVRATARLPIKLGSVAATGGAQTTVLPTRLETNVTGRDFLTMFMLWAHGLAAMGWVIGVVAMTIALSTQPLLAGPVRAGISAAYRKWGAWVHWSFVPVIVATGIYNMVYVTPFKLRWPWSSELDGIAYGNTYEAILFVKLGLFMVLLATGTALLLRVMSPAKKANVESTAGPLRTLVSALGAPGLVYVTTVPLILGAAMALRYVHILSHVAEVVNSR